ncbi:MAG: transaldolase, partial [Streptosporangiales bacterium]|nr:transaldolase [Streptosporangiales bacterium]
ISQCLAEGISINVTLIFSLQRYADVIDAFFEGMERARKVGRDLSVIGSVASFFVSRVDTEVDKRLDKIGGDEAEALRGKAAVANAQLAYELYEQKFGTERWQQLAAAGAKVQRPLWASTSTKDPSLPDTVYVDELVTRDVVNTMPEATIHATADHGHITGDTVHAGYESARKVLADLERIGVSYDDVVRVLEEEGVEKFASSWSALVGGVGQELERLAPKNGDK